MSLGLSIAARLAALPSKPKTSTPSLAALIAPTDTAHGPLYLLEHSAQPALHLPSSSLEALALTTTALDTSRPLYFDTETTGLAGGTVTLAFLVGIAEVRAEQLIISQVHLPGPGHERPMLQWLSARIEASSMLLSFNGRSFDWPLLRSRYVMNRLAPPPVRPHVDLLHCARRVFRHQLDELRLATLERRILGLHRHDDIDGANIPTAWFDYLRSGREAVLARVLSHNAQDVRSMVQLVQHLVAVWEERHPVLPPTALGLASVAARRKDDARALRFLQHAAEGKTTAMACSLEADVRRRRGEYQEAATALLRAVTVSPQPAPLHLRLAKLYEHRLHDLDAALHHTAQAVVAESATAHASRRQRLLRRSTLK